MLNQHLIRGLVLVWIISTVVYASKEKENDAAKVHQESKNVFKRNRKIEVDSVYGNLKRKKYEEDVDEQKTFPTAMNQIDNQQMETVKKLLRDSKGLGLFLINMIMKYLLPSLPEVDYCSLSINNYFLAVQAKENKHHPDHPSLTIWDRWGQEQLYSFCPLKSNPTEKIAYSNHHKMVVMFEEENVFTTFTIITHFAQFVLVNMVKHPHTQGEILEIMYALKFDAFLTRGEDKSLKLWTPVDDIGTFEECETFVVSNPPAQSPLFGFSTWYSYTAVAKSDGISIGIFKGLKKHSVLIGHDQQVTVVAFAPSTSGILVSAGKDGKVNVWNVQKGTLLQTYHVGKEDWVTSCAFSESHMVCTTNRNELKFFYGKSIFRSVVWYDQHAKKCIQKQNK